MTSDPFAGEGVGALLVAVSLLAVAGLIMAWLLGPGSRPHDPPVARDQVRWFAATLVIFAAGWGVRAVWGVGGFLVTSALLIVIIGAVALVRRRRSSP
jgi:hypothetical protein